jgi:hypothetical protein
MRITVTNFRRWFSRKLYLWSCYVYEDWHDVVIVSPDGELIEFCCYGDICGSWPASWGFTCSCEQDGN